MKTYTLILLTFLSLFTNTRVRYDSYEKGFLLGEEKIIPTQQGEVRVSICAGKLDSLNSTTLLKVKYSWKIKGVKNIYVIFKDNTYSTFYPYYTLSHLNTVYYILIGKDVKLKTKKVNGVLLPPVGSGRIREENYFINFFEKLKVQ